MVLPERKKFTTPRNLQYFPNLISKITKSYLKFLSAKQVKKIFVKPA